MHTHWHPAFSLEADSCNLALQVRGDELKSLSMRL